LEDRLGEGCFARVYACRKVIDGSEDQFAVKITDLKGQKDEMRERVARQEARILRKLWDCENCCRLIDSMFCERFHYIVLERCTRPLMAVLEGLPELTELGLTRFVSQMFKAVACVHTHGVVHRDVKPDNFLWSGPEDTVKLCDFGLAEVVRTGGRGVSGQFGTAPFMSPEMIWGGNYGTLTDVWSLGVSLYTFVFGQFPYVPEKACVKLMKAAIASGVPEPNFRCVSEGVELSHEVVNLVRGLIHREPEERPRAADALGHRWFCAEAEGERRPKHSLKEALSAANKVGAFTISDRATEARPRSPDSIDLALQELQSKHQGQDPEDNNHFGLPALGEKEDDEETRMPSGDSVSTAAMSQRGTSSRDLSVMSHRGSGGTYPDLSPSSDARRDRLFSGTHPDMSPSSGARPDRPPSVTSSSGSPSRARPYGDIITRT